MTDESAEDGDARQPRPVSYNDAARRYGPGRITARERYDELSMRDHLARAYAKLRASGHYDPARHGPGDTKPLTADEHLELLATAEYLSRSYKSVPEVDHALQAGASWAQVAAALGTDDATARANYRAWADGQHDMLAWTEGRLGMSDAEYAEAMERAAAAVEPDNVARPFGRAILCAHADQDGAGAHWLEPGDNCSADREAGL